MTQVDIKQLKVGPMANFSYILKSQGYAAVVDPSFGGKPLVDMLRESKLDLKYVILTHHHFDHVKDAALVADSMGSEIVAHSNSPLKKDVSVDDSSVLKVGSSELRIIHTPGHTPDSICVLGGGGVFTGDTLFVGECGRVDLPGGSATDMYSSLFKKLAKLPHETVVYPGHDYGKTPSSTIGAEIRTNYVLKPRTIEEFLEFMSTP
ncbi:MAG: MBL fold metallo-hydrolase [Thermoprotei archaeon]